VVNGFTGSSIWHSIYAFPPTDQDYWDKGFEDFAKRFGPILDEFDKQNVNFGLEVHPTSQWELFIYRLGAEKWCIGAALRELKMPQGTRIGALFRNQQLLHPSGSTRLEAGDMLCVIGHEHDLPALGKLFSQAPKRGQDLRFFGDFVLEGDAELSAVAALYGLKVTEADSNQQLGRFIAQEIGGEPVVGDQVEWQGLTWTVATMEGNKIRKVGVKFPEGSRPSPGLFL